MSGILNLTISNEFTAATVSPTNKVNIIETPILKSYQINIVIINVQAKFAVAPIDKSIPFTANVKVSPIAIIAVIEILLTIVIILSVVNQRLLPWAESQLPNVNIKNNRIIVIIVPHLLTNFTTFLLSFCFSNLSSILCSSC